MSYSGAGQPAPAAGTTAGYVFFKAMFDYIFATFNADDTIISGATNAYSSSAQNNTLVKRGSAGDVALGTLSAAPLTPSGTAGIYVNLPSGHTGNAFQALINNVNIVAATAAGQLVTGSSGITITTATGYLDATKLANAVPPANGGTGATSLTAGALLVGAGTSAVTTLAPGTSGTIVQSNGTAWTAAALAASLIADYKATPGSAGQITIAAGGAWEDSNNAHISALPQQTANLPAQPSGTNIQYVALSLAPTTGAPVVTGGAVGASPAKPSYPIGNRPIAMVTWRGVTTLPSGIVAAADVEDARFGGGGGGGGTGSAGGVAASAAFLSNGNLTGTYGNSLDIANVLNSSWAPASGSADVVSRLKSKSTDAAVSDMFANAMNGAWLGAFSVSGAQVVLTPSTGPLALDGGSLGRRVNSAATTSATRIGGTGNSAASASGALALYYVYADFSGTGPTFGITLYRQGATPDSGVVGPLAIALWDGTTLKALAPLAFGTLRGPNLSADTGMSAYSGAYTFPNTPSTWLEVGGASPIQVSYSNSIPMKGVVWMCGNLSVATGATTVNLSLELDGSILTGNQYTFTLAANTGVGFAIPFFFEANNTLPVANNALYHYFRAVGYSTTPANVTVNCYLRYEFMAV